METLPWAIVACAFFDAWRDTKGIKKCRALIGPMRASIGGMGATRVTPLMLKSGNAIELVRGVSQASSLLQEHCRKCGQCELSGR